MYLSHSCTHTLSIEILLPLLLVAIAVHLSSTLLSATRIITLHVDGIFTRFNSASMSSDIIKENNNIGLVAVGAHLLKPFKVNSPRNTDQTAVMGSRSPRLALLALEVRGLARAFECLSSVYFSDQKRNSLSKTQVTFHQFPKPTYSYSCRKPPLGFKYLFCQ